MNPKYKLLEISHPEKIQHKFLFDKNRKYSEMLSLITLDKITCIFMFGFFLNQPYILVFNVTES